MAFENFQYRTNSCLQLRTALLLAEYNGLMLCRELTVGRLRGQMFARKSIVYSLVVGKVGAEKGRTYVAASAS